MIHKTYLIFPFKADGSACESERAKEEELVKELVQALIEAAKKDERQELLNENFYLIRPFKEVAPTAPKRRVLRNRKRLLDKCDSVLLAGKWRKYDDCLDEFDKAVADKKKIYTFRDGTVYRKN